MLQVTQTHLSMKLDADVTQFLRRLGISPVPTVKGELSTCVCIGA